MKKRLIYAKCLGAGIVMMAVLAGCGGSDGGEATPEQTKPSVGAGANPNYMKAQKMRGGGGQRPTGQ